MCVHSLRGQHLLTGVGLCFPLRGLPLLPGVARCPSEWTCAHRLRGPHRPAWTRRGCLWLADPRAYPLPPPPPPRRPACTPCGQSAGSPWCPPLCAPSAGPHAGIQLLRDAQHLHTEVGHLCWAQRTAPRSGAGHVLRMPNEGHIVHCEIDSVGAAGVEALLLGTGSPGSLVTWSTEPGSRLWSWGVFPQSPASPSSQAVPGWKHPVGSAAQAPNTQAGPLAMRTHKTHKGLCPSPETVLGKARRNQVGRTKGRNICPPHK